MKKQLALAAGLAVLATPAIASKARLQALGEDTNGSFYINDNRNIFLNAAEVSNHKDMVTFEWGSAVPNGAGATDENVDRIGQSNAEGGFLRASGNLVYGAQFGRQTQFAADYQVVSGQNSVAQASRFAPSNAIDLFIGGDAGIKWGVQATYSDREADAHVGATTKAEASELGLAVGVSSGNLAGYLKYGVSGSVDTKTNTTEVENKSPMELGASYKWMDYTFFGQYNSRKITVDNGTVENDVETKSYQLGAARSSKLSDKATFFTKVAYTNNATDFDDLGTAGEESNSKQLPVTIGLEYDAASWLALRGSVSQSVFVNEFDNGTDKNTVANTTNVNAGASLKFGDLSVDGVLGTGAATNDTSETGVFNTDNLMSRVSMTYRF